MEVKELNIEELIPYEKNPRKNNEAVKYVAESIKQFGFKVPIVIDKDNIVIAGHTRLKAAKKLKMDTVPCIVADDLTDEQVKAFRLADNKVGELAEWDIDLLGEELSGILEIDMSSLGFDDLFEEEDPYDIPNDEKGSLLDRYIVPPFSVLDTRQGYWNDRKRLWREKIQDNAEARSEAKVYGDGYGFKGFNPVSLLDPVLSEIIVKWYAPKQEIGNKCFDVFAGDTVFGFVSSYLGKQFTGVELRKEQADFNNERVKEFDLNAKYICDDGRNVLKHIEKESQDLLFSCPPYYDLEVYSDMEEDASNQETYEEFYQILDTAFANAIKCLKDDRFAVIVVGDVRNRKTGVYYDFLGDIKNTFKRNGMGLYNELILINPFGTAPVRANNQMKTRKNVKVHQNVLVFYKGDTNKIKDNFDEIDFEEVLEEYASEDE